MKIYNLFRVELDDPNMESAGTPYFYGTFKSQLECIECAKNSSHKKKYGTTTVTTVEELYEVSNPYTSEIFNEHYENDEFYMFVILEIDL